MTLTKSQRKAFVEGPRARDLKPLPPAPVRPAQRDENGRFIPGTTAGVGKGLTIALRRGLGGASATDADIQRVTADAKRIFGATIKVMPSDAAPVRALVVLHARALAMNAYLVVAAERAGLTTPEGLRLLEVADRQSQRAERALVTALDVARVMAEQERHHSPAFPWRPTQDSVTPSSIPRLVHEGSPVDDGVTGVSSEAPDPTNINSGATVEVRPCPHEPSPTAAPGVSLPDETPNPPGDVAPHEATALAPPSPTQDEPQCVLGAPSAISPATHADAPRRPDLPEHLRQLNAPNPYYLARVREQDELNWRREQEREWDRRGTPGHERRYRPMPDKGETP